MKHQVKLRSQAYYRAHSWQMPNEYSRLVGTVVKTTAHSVWIEGDRVVAGGWSSALGVKDGPNQVIRKFMLKDNGLWHLVGSKGKPRPINFKLDPLLEFTFG